MNKIKTIAAVAAAITAFSALGASAQDMNMYVNDHYVVRDMQTVSGFDMLPILDIAVELGFNCSFDGTTITLYNDSKSYVFTVGSASVYDESGNWYGLDVVPQVMNGKVRVPAKFFQDAMGMSYVWDAVTNTVFLGSENTYNWLIGTWEYQEAEKQKLIRDTMDERLKNLYDPFYYDDLRVWIDEETSNNYYVMVMWYNCVTGNYNLWGNFIVNKETGNIYDRFGGDLICSF